jgi:hypothetical protein
MRDIIKGLLTASALITLTGTAARADAIVPITDGGGWNEFFFLAPGSNLQTLGGATIDFTFTLTHPDVLRITDGFQGGDQFDLMINSVDKGPTSASVLGFAGTAGSCWTCAYYNPTYGDAYTHGAYVLGPGSYVVTGIALQSPQFDGAGALALGAIPEPATWAMMLAGFLGLGAVMRRSRRQAVATA